MLRAVVKMGSSRILHWTGADRLTATLGGAAGRPVVIGYHRVVEDFASEAKYSIPPMLISRRMLACHLDWLSRRFDLISIDELGLTLSQGRKFERPTAAITFDDGYRDNYYNAFPLLKQKGIPAAIFVTTGWIDSPQPLIHDRLYRLLHCAFSQWRDALRDLACLLDNLGISPIHIRQLRSIGKDSFAVMRFFLSKLSQEYVYRIAEALEDKLDRPINAQAGIEPLSWEMLAEMHHAGITIGSHTRTHILLTNEAPRTVQQELDGSRRDLEAKLGITIRHFAYPDGRFNNQTVRAVAAVGYRFAYTVCRHRDPEEPLLTIPRRLLWENSCRDADGSFSPAMMSCQLNGVFDFLSGCSPNRHPPTSERPNCRQQEGWVL